MLEPSTTSSDSLSASGDAGMLSRPGEWTEDPALEVDCCKGERPKVLLRRMPPVGRFFMGGGGISVGW